MIAMVPFLSWVAMLSIEPGAEARCTVPVLFGGPHEQVMYVHARATGVTDSVAVGPGSARMPWGHFGEMDPPETTQAWEFRVLAATGGEAAPAEGELIRVVPWSYTADCSSRPWGQEAWVAQGEEVVLTFAGESVRALEGVYHVRGSAAAYPQGSWHRVRGRTHPEPGPGEHWMTAEDFFRLTSMLPPRGRSGFAENRDAYANTVRIIEESPWPDQYPASEMLRMSRSVLGGGP